MFSQRKSHVSTNTSKNFQSGARLTVELQLLFGRILSDTKQCTFLSLTVQMQAGQKESEQKILSICLSN